jgi:hypothetical protein
MEPRAVLQWRDTVRFGGDLAQPSGYGITFTHPDDTNPANNTITITTGLAPPG